VDEGELPPPSFFKQDHLDGTSQVLGDEILAPSVAVVMPAAGNASCQQGFDGKPNG
jgi:hypothetical protein